MNLEQVHAAAMELTRRLGQRPVILRVGHAAWIGAETMIRNNRALGASTLGRFGPPGANIPDYFDPTPGVILLGLIVELDQWLQPAAWRLCDADGTLLYDSREGTHAL